MTRIDSRPLLAVALSTVVLAYVGCSSSGPAPESSPVPAPDPAARSASGSEPAPEKASAEAHTEASSSKAKLFADWPTPLAALIVSGQQDGYLEPCGCTQGQLGGLIRRYDFIERLRKQDWPVAVIDLGGLVKDPISSRGGLDQSKVKFTIALEALATLGCQALALSVDDLKIGVGEAMAQYLNLSKGPGVVVANVTPVEGFEATIKPSNIIESGPIKFGITSVIDPEEFKKLSDPDKEVMLPTVKTPEEVLPAILAKLETTSDVQVLMVRGPVELAKKLGEAHPGFDVIVATTPYPDPPLDPDTINGGKTLVITVGRKGKYVGAVGVFADADKRLRYQRVTLGPNYDGKAATMRKIVEDRYRETLKNLKIVEDFTRHDFVNNPGAKFVGAETCKQCHAKTYDKWAGSKHATAFESLLDDPKPNAIFDAECVSCHTTGFEYTSGYKSQETTGFLEGNQCENCHGPGSKHSADPTNAEFLKRARITAESADKTGQCLRCHDEDNSPKFTDFAEWWKKIEHKGLDDYSDPKVRKGIAEKVARTPAPKSEPTAKSAN